MRFGESDLSAEQRLAELENSLSQVKLDPVENATLLAPLLDIPLSSERALALAPEELRRRQLAALTAWVLAGARVSCSRLKMRTGLIRRRLIFCAALLSAERWRRCSF
jgi:hypothetical protein